MVKENKQSKIVVLWSGGMDSTTLVWDMANRVGKENVYTLSIDYNQRHVKELEQVANMADKHKINNIQIDLSAIGSLITASSLTSDAKVPEGHYAEANMKQTVVPNRNAILLSIAAGYALSIGAPRVAFAAHSGDHAIYPDCRIEFVEALNTTISIGNYNPVEVIAPFINMSKTDIVDVGTRLNVPYAETWSCYNGKERPCLKCGTCVERTEAFVQCELIDPALTEDEWNAAVKYYLSVKDNVKV